jgi:hypothetical protein
LGFSFYCFFFFECLKLTLALEGTRGIATKET